MLSTLYYEELLDSYENAVLEKAFDKADRILNIIHTKLVTTRLAKTTLAQSEALYHRLSYTRRKREELKAYRTFYNIFGNSPTHRNDVFVLCPKVGCKICTYLSKEKERSNNG